MQELLARKFGQNKLRYHINPDEAVAIGAAILAHSPEEYSSNIGDNVNVPSKNRRKKELQQAKEENKRKLEVRI